MRTPSFWYKDKDAAPSAVELALTPLSCLYLLGHKIHQARFKAEKADVPVICVGNINAGGSGKTPSAVALMKLLKKLGLFEKPFFLTRGYGGDEAILLNRVAPTIIASDRIKGAKEAMGMQADAIIMDDGFQNGALQKDLSFVVVDGAMGFGNGRLLPAGPLREPLEAGFARADAFIVLNEDLSGAIDTLPRDKPVFKATLKPEADQGIDMAQPYLAFAGIGYPEKFFMFLRNEMGLNIVQTKSFADHHPYDVNEMRALVSDAEKLDAKLLTTEKDFLRVPEIAQSQVRDVRVFLEWKNENALAEFIKGHLGR